jgi:hypothetical protein
MGQCFEKASRPFIMPIGHPACSIQKTAYILPLKQPLRDEADHVEVKAFLKVVKRGKPVSPKGACTSCQQVFRALFTNADRGGVGFYFSPALLGLKAKAFGREKAGKKALSKDFLKGPFPYRAGRLGEGSSSRLCRSRKALA